MLRKASASWRNAHRLLFLLAVGLSFIVLSSCKPEKTKFSTINDNKNKISSRSLFKNPDDAEIELVKLANERSPLILDLVVPTLSLEFTNADYIQILRCTDQVQIRTPTGAPFGSLSKREQRKWVWNDLKSQVNNSGVCKIIASKSISKIVNDLTVAAGTYFYVVNPCFSEEVVLDEDDYCGYHLAFSDKIEVKHANTFERQILDSLQSLNTAQTSLNALLVNSQQLAKKIEVHLQACEDFVQKDQQLLDFKKGLVSLGGMALGFAAGLFIGPNAAIMLATGVQALFTELIGPRVLKLPLGIENECVDPNIVATTAQERELRSKDDKTNQNQHRGKYEEEFRVAELSRRFEKMIDTDMTFAKAQVVKELENVAKFNDKVLTFDRAIKELYQQDADKGVNELKTMQDILDRYLFR